LTAERNTAETTHSTAAGEEAGLQSLYDGAKATSDASAATTATKAQEKADANAKNAEWIVQLASANAAIDATGSGIAKTKADEDATLLTKLGELKTTRDAWVIKAQATTTAMATWMKTTYTSVSADNGCDGDLSAA
jgi:hypothetical protein